MSIDFDADNYAALEAADARARSYGAQLDGLGSAENALQRSRIHRDGNVEVDWTHPQLARITCLRLIGASWREYPRWDVSYCYGELKNGTAVRVRVGFGNGDLPLNTNPRRGRTFNSALIDFAKRDGVYAKGLGLLDPGNYSMLYG